MDKSTPEATEQVAAPVTPDSQVTDSGTTAEQTTSTSDERGESQGTRDVNANSSQPDETSSTTSDDGTASQFDDDLDKWAEKRGYGKLETEKERRIAQDARNNQRDFHKGRGGDELNTQVEDVISNGNDDDIRQEIAILKARDMTRDYFDRNPNAKEYESTMAELVKDEAEKRGDEAAYWLAQDLDRLYTLAKSKGATATAEDIEKARREERESLAQKQAAGVAPSAATTQTAPPKEDAGKALRDMSLNDYWTKKHQGWNPIRDL
jgi:hypothetical protein